VWFKIPVSFAPSVQISTLDDNSTGIDTMSDVTIPSSLESIKFISASSSIPTTSNTIVSAFVLSSVTASASSRVRLGLTACRETTWVSESSVQCRAASGIDKSPRLIVTAYGGISNSPELIASVREVVVPAPAAAVNVSYAHAPVVKNVSNSVKNILVGGSSFGDYIAIVPYSNPCNNLTTVAAQTSAALCSSDLTQSLGDITEAAFSLRLQDFTRLDDISIAVVNPKGVSFTLMQKKCYGCMKPATSNFITMSFNIPTLAVSTEIPDSQCDSRNNNFMPLSSDALAAAFQSSDTRGVWSLAVTAGASPVSVTNIIMFFKT
jgi:hypothetical protein